MGPDGHSTITQEPESSTLATWARVLGSVLFLLALAATVLFIGAAVEFSLRVTPYLVVPLLVLTALVVGISVWLALVLRRDTWSRVHPGTLFLATGLVLGVCLLVLVMDLLFYAF